MEKAPENKPSRYGGLGSLLLFCGLVGLVIYLVVRVFNGEKFVDHTFNDLITNVYPVSANRIAEVEIRQNREIPTGVVILKLKDGTMHRAVVPDVNEAAARLTYENVDYIFRDVPEENYFLKIYLPVILIGVIFAVALIVIMVIRDSVMYGGGDGQKGVLSFGKSRATMTQPGEKSIKFSDVAGLKEEKEDLEEIVDFLSHPQKYLNVGARIPKGVILVGPPGTGKTLLAKAVAGEAGVPYFSISGSDFVEMFVGVGASRVRDLFAEAKEHSPCIVFIDEIDAVARRRGTGLGGGHDEREQTLNQILVEMDGFEVNEGVIVMAATNRVDILDPAILRPGRFDRKIVVGRPDVEARHEILKVHSRKKPLMEDVDLETIARTTAGFTGADLENLLNEAAIQTAKTGRKAICQSDIELAFVKVGIGTEKRSKIISDQEKRITAYHEIGHAILFHLLPDVGPVHTVSIIPTGSSAAGYTMPLPGKDEMFITRSKMLQEIVVSLGGRVAEEIIFGADEITTGASADIKQATAYAREMVTEYGMSSSLGMIHYGSDDSGDVFIGRDLARTRSYSEDVASRIDAEIKRIIDECYEKAHKMIESHMDVLHNGAALLLEKEKIGREDFEALFTASATPETAKV